MKSKSQIIRSSGNVFADLGLPDAKDALRQAELLVKIQRLIEQQGWTQLQIAKLAEVPKAKVSDLLKGRLADFSAKQLSDILNRLERNSDDLKAEYELDFSKAKTHRFASRINQDKLVVELDPDISKVFNSSASVNAVLRALIATMPKNTKQKTAAKNKT